MTTGFSGNTYTGSNEPTPVERAYAKGYWQGRIVTLHDVIALCEKHDGVMGAAEGEMRRLLAEAEAE